MAASSIVIAGPAGAITNACNESMNPAGQGNASGLTVACTFVSAGAAGTSFTINDAYDATSGGLGVASGALYHYGAARVVNVTVTRSGSSTAGKTTIKTCATNNTTATVSNAACPAPGALAGNLAITAADVNHSIEFASSNTNLTGKFINPGSFIKSVSGTTVTLSKATLAGGPLCPASPGPAAGNCTTSVSAQVLVSNGTNRAVLDGVTAAGSATVTSATANFLPGDVGARVSGGDLPDGATILTRNSATSVTLTCTACLSGFAGVSSATAQVITIDPKSPTTSTRYVTDGISGANKTLTSTTAKFANTDIGLPVVFNPAIANVKGARILSVAADGSSANLTAPANLTAGAKKFTIGVPTKTAPATNDTVGTLAIELTVNPTVSPTSPPCDAGKVSGFHIPLQWKNPGSYGFTNNGTTHVEGAIVSPTSIGQLIFNTASTSFGGFLKQNVTVAAQVPTTAGYVFKIEFAPIALGVCTGTPIAETVGIGGLSVKQVQNPTFTGGGGGGTRALGPIPDGQSVTYTGATGANVVTQGSDPTDTNSCTVSSPNTIQIGC